MKMISKSFYTFIIVGLLVSCSSGKDNFGEKIVQVSINRVDSMPDIPETYKMLNWRQKAKDYDRFIFDWNNKSEVGPLIWLDDARRNIDQTTLVYIQLLKISDRGKMQIMESFMKV